MIIALLKNTEKKVVGKEPTGREFLFVYVCVAGRSLSPSQTKFSKWKLSTCVRFINAADGQRKKSETEMKFSIHPKHVRYYLEKSKNPNARLLFSDSNPRNHGLDLIKPGREFSFIV